MEQLTKLTHFKKSDNVPRMPSYNHGAHDTLNSIGKTSSQTE